MSLTLPLNSMIIWGVALFASLFISSFAFAERQPCGQLKEPSGVIQLLDGRVLVVEDEKQTPFRLLSLNGASTTSITPLKTTQILADLEAVDIDKNGFIYAITSHSLTSKSKRSTSREKLVRFKIVGNQIRNLEVMPNLKKSMTSLTQSLKKASKVLDVKGGNGFNIEGLSFDKDKQSLLIGLRTPVIDKQAVLLVLKNPKAVFDQGEPPKFKKKPIYLDLDKGGIRSITFDSKLNGYLIISRQEKKGKPFKLWFWKGGKNDAPRRIRLKGDLDLSNAEGITAICDRGGQGELSLLKRGCPGVKKLMLVFDVGNPSKRKNGCYAFLSYDALNISGIKQK